MAAAFKFELVSPERLLVSGEVEQVLLISLGLVHGQDVNTAPTTRVSTDVRVVSSTAPVSFSRGVRSDGLVPPGSALLPGMDYVEVTGVDHVAPVMPATRAYRFISATTCRNRGRVQGSMAPWLSDLLLSGITRSRSKSIVLPKPWHRGQAP